MFKSYFGETVTVVLALVMGAIMSVTAIIVDRLAWNYSNLFKLWAMITLVILLVSCVIPYKSWSARFTGLFPLKKGGIAYKMVDNILPTMVLNTSITVMVSAANILYNESIPAEAQIAEWTQRMVHDWPITLVVSYFAAFLAEAAGIWVAKKNGASIG